MFCLLEAPYQCFTALTNKVIYLIGRAAAPWHGLQGRWWSLWPHTILSIICGRFDASKTKVEGARHLQKLSFICLSFPFFPTSLFSSFSPGFPAHRGPDCQGVFCHLPLARTASTAIAAAAARTGLESPITCNSDLFFYLETCSHKKS